MNNIEEKVMETLMEYSGGRQDLPARKMATEIILRLLQPPQPSDDEIERQIKEIKLSRDHYKSEYEKLITDGQLWRKVDEDAKKHRYIIGLTDTDEIVKVHFAQDLSGEEQPAFSGFFQDCGSYNAEVKLKRWMPLPPTDLFTTKQKEG